MWPMLALAGVQMLSNINKEDRQRKLAASTQRYSPWTGNKANEIEEANPAGDMAQAYAGYSGQQQSGVDRGLRQKLLQAQIDALNRGGSGSSPWAMRMQGDGSSDLYGNGNFSNVG